MSLDVYLVRKKWTSYDEGKTWEEGKEEVYHSNITHNLNIMAEKAGIYNAIWRPYRLSPDFNPEEKDFNAESEFEESVIIKASDIIDIVEKGFEDMKARPDYYMQFDSPNGWGLYKNFLPWIFNYLEACKKCPDAIIEVSR